MFRQYWSRSMNKLSEVSVFELNATTDGKNWVEKKRKELSQVKRKKKKIELRQERHRSLKSF